MGKLSLSESIERQVFPNRNLSIVEGTTQQKIHQVGLSQVGISFSYSSCWDRLASEIGTIWILKVSQIYLSD